jgi:hypothetical protein
MHLAAEVLAGRPDGVRMLAAAVLAAGFLPMGAVAWRKHPRSRVGLLAAVIGVLVLLEPLLPGPERVLAAGWASRGRDGRAATHPGDL